MCVQYFRKSNMVAATKWRITYFFKPPNMGIKRNASPSNFILISSIDLHVIFELTCYFKMKKPMD